MPVPLGALLLPNAQGKVCTEIWVVNRAVNFYARVSVHVVT